MSQDHIISSVKARGIQPSRASNLSLHGNGDKLGKVSYKVVQRLSSPATCLRFVFNGHHRSGATRD